MTSSTLLTLNIVAGLAAGGVAAFIIGSLLHRRATRDTRSQLSRGNAIQDLHYALTAMTYRCALEKLEDGDVHGAKKELSEALATYYYAKRDATRELSRLSVEAGLPAAELSRSDEPEQTGELRAIELAAKRSESLRLAMLHKEAAAESNRSAAPAAAPSTASSSAARAS